MSRDATTAGRFMLAFDTATEEAVVAVGDTTGRVVSQDRWRTRHLHGERLLGSVGKVLAAAGAAFQDVRALVVGTGPGSFTGLRVGLAAAKGLAFGLGIPVVGIETPLALVAALAGGARRAADVVVVVLQPAGPSGRYRTVVALDRDGSLRALEEPTLVMAEDEPVIPTGAVVLALDLPDSSAEAGAAGQSARAGLAAALLGVGTERLVAAGPDDLAELVPAYITLPRGTGGVVGEIRWSHDRL